MDIGQVPSGTHIFLLGQHSQGGGHGIGQIPWARVYDSCQAMATRKIAKNEIKELIAFLAILSCLCRKSKARMGLRDIAQAHPFIAKILHMCEGPLL